MMCGKHSISYCLMFKIAPRKRQKLNLFFLDSDCQNEFLMTFLTIPENMTA